MHDATRGHRMRLAVELPRVWSAALAAFDWTGAARPTEPHERRAPARRKKAP